MVKWWNAVLPVLTLVLGYVGTVLVESRRARVEREAAGATRLAVREDARSDARRAFELETLIALQEAMSTMVRASGKAHHFDVMSAREAQSDRLVNFQLPDSVSDEIFAANREVGKLVGRVLDQPVREAVEDLREAVITQNVRLDVTLAEGDQQMLVIANSVDAAQKLVAARVRGIYDGSVTF